MKESQSIGVHLDSVEEREPVRGYHGRFVHSDSMTIAFWRVDPKSSIPEHSHPHEQIASCIEGEFELTVGGVLHRMKAGSVVTIPSNVPHSGRSLTACRLIDVFHPARDDYR